MPDNMDLLPYIIKNIRGFQQFHQKNTGNAESVFPILKFLCGLQPLVRKKCIKYMADASSNPKEYE